MANTKLDRIERDIEKTRAKILEQQKKLKDLEAQKVEEENAQIVQMVKAVHLDGTQLAAFLSAYASGEITLPQPEATYPAEQGRTTTMKNKKIIRKFYRIACRTGYHVRAFLLPLMRGAVAMKATTRLPP